MVHRRFKPIRGTAQVRIRRVCCRAQFGQAWPQDPRLAAREAVEFELGARMTESPTDLTDLTLKDSHRPESPTKYIGAPAEFGEHIGKHGDD